MKTVSKMQHKINKWKYSPRKLSALLTKKSYTRSGSELSGEAQQREKPRAHRRGPALATQLPGDPRALLRCLAAQVLPKKKRPKTLPKTCSPELFREGSRLPEKGFPDGAWWQQCQTPQLK